MFNVPYLNFANKNIIKRNFSYEMISRLAVYTWVLPDACVTIGVHFVCGFVWALFLISKWIGLGPLFEYPMRVKNFGRQCQNKMEKEKRRRYSGAISKVNNDMYMSFKEIISTHALRYLPAKSIYRCKAVCKDWKSLMSTPFFEHSQSYFSRSLSGLFGQRPEGSIFFISPDPMAYGVPDPEMKFLPEPVDLVASSNGLLCCRGLTDDRPYYICNPANRQWRKLPKPDADHGLSPALVLVFEPSLLSFEANYRLICAFPSEFYPYAYEFEIYSSMDNLWKTSSEICFGEGRRVLDRGVHLDGVVHWLTNDNFLLRFNWMTHSAKLIPCYDAVYGTDTLGVVDEKLCFSRRRGTELSVYAMSNLPTQTSSEDKTWEKRVMLLDETKMRPEVKQHELSASSIGSDLIVFDEGGTILTYNLKTKETTNLRIEWEYSCSCLYVPYVNSLVNLQ